VICQRAQLQLQCFSVAEINPLEWP
jgi:hypothetical protein